jgi:hypothetical protein
MKTINCFRLIILITFTPALHCMEAFPESTITNDIRRALAQHYFSHDTICALALVNKQWNNIVKQTAQDRQKFLTNQTDYPNLLSIANKDEQLVWHTHKSAYGYWFNTSESCIKKHHKMIFSLVYLDGNGTIHSQADSSDSYRINGKTSKGHTKVKIVQKPFFTRNGDFTFHTFQLYGDYSIVENVLSTKEKPKNFNCYVMCLPENVYDAIPDLTIFKNYPTLLHAITHSKSSQSFYTERSDYKIYYLEGVELDEDYFFTKDAFPPLLTERTDKYSFKRIPDDSFSIARKAFREKCIIKKTIPLIEINKK